MKAAPFAVLAALALSACAEGADYAYDYDPYLGVRGHHVGFLDGRPARTAPTCSHLVYTGPYSDGYREPYYAGPFCADGAAVNAAARVADTSPGQ